MATKCDVSGNFEHESSEGLVEFLMAVAGTSHAEKVKTYARSKPRLVITIDDDQFTFHLTQEGKTIVIGGKLGVPYDETMPNGMVFKSISTYDGDNKYTTVTELPDGNKTIRTYYCTDARITVHYSDEKTGLKAVRIWKRV